MMQREQWNRKLVGLDFLAEESVSQPTNTFFKLRPTLLSQAPIGWVWVVESLDKDHSCNVTYFMESRPAATDGKSIEASGFALSEIPPSMLCSAILRPPNYDFQLPLQTRVDVMSPLPLPTGWSSFGMTGNIQQISAV